MNQTQQWIHDERTPGGLGQVITLTTTELRRESKGALGGGISVAIPVASITAFHAVEYQYVSMTGASRGAGPSQFLLRWTDAAGAMRSDTWMVDVGAATFRALYAALAQLRPDASTAGMSNEQAHRAVGKTSLARTQMITIAVVLVVVLVPLACLITGGLLWLVLQSSPL